MTFFQGILLMIVVSFLKGFAVKLLWGWFLVPILGLPVISIAQAIGITALISLLTIQHIPRDDDRGQIKDFIIFEIAVPIIAVVFGWIVHFFV